MKSITFTNDNGITIFIPDDNDCLTTYSHFFPQRDKHEILFRQICTFLINTNTIDKNIIDLGAWIGDNALPWAKNITGLVYAIDPSLQNCRYIELLTKLNGVHNVSIIRKAISDKPQTISTNDNVEHCAFQMNDTGDIKEEATTLDILYDENTIDNIGFIHLDVEGMEWLVIQGAQKIISKFRPVICFEQHIETDNYGLIVQFLKDRNYRVFLINETLPGCNLDCRNFIAFPVEKCSILEDMYTHFRGQECLIEY